MKRIGTLAMVLLGSVSLSAQDPVFTLRVDVPLVTVDVSVLDAQQKPILALSESDFTVYEDGVQQQIQSFSSVDTPYNILLLFDRSGSTTDQWPFMQRATARFIGNLRDQDRVALGAFDEGLIMFSGWEDSRETTLAAIDEIPKRGPGAGTNLFGALQRATQREFRNTMGRRAVVVLTDGRDNQFFAQSRQRSQGSQDPRFLNMVQAIQETRIPVYFVALNTDKNPDGFSEYPQYLSAEIRLRMERIAGASNGKMFFPKNIRDIVGVYDQVSRDLSMSYSLSYISSHGNVKGESHRIEVKVHKTGAQVRQFRDGYITP